MQESELETPGLEESQEWVDVPHNQVTEENTTATVETTQGDEVAVEQTVTVVHQSEVSVKAPWSRLCDENTPRRTYPYLRRGTLTGQRTKKEDSRLSPGCKPNLGRLRHLPLQTGHNPFLIRIRQMSLPRLQMAICQPKMTALRKLAEDVADHVEIIVVSGEEAAVESVVIVVAIVVVVSAEASGGIGVVLGAVRGAAVSESSEA